MFQSEKIDQDQASGVTIRPGNLRVVKGMRSAVLKIGILTLVGSLLPLLFVNAVTRNFSVETRLRIDAASDIAVSDAATALRSKATLDNLIRALNLGRGSEFAADRPSAVRVVSDIMSGDAMTVSQVENRLRDRLSQAIKTTYDRRTGQFAISVTAAEADEAAHIANMLGDRFRDGIVVSGGRTASPLVEQLRQTLDHAEAALSGFIAQTDQQKLKAMRSVEGDGRQLAADINDAQAQLADLKTKFAQASAMKLEDILTKPLPDSLEYTGLEYQRQRYVTAKLAADQLSNDLGPRHPRLAAAKAAFEDVRNDIQTALKQLTTSLRQQQATAAQRLADLKAKQARKPDDKEIADSSTRLASLEAAVNEARGNYLEAQHRFDATANVPVARVQVLAPATVNNAQALGPSLAEISGGGALIGFCLGMALAFSTRRKPLAADDDADAHHDEIEVPTPPVSAVEPEWTDEGHEPDKFLADDYDAVYDEPVAYDEPIHQYQPPMPQRYPAPANDSPLADHIRELLMANRRPTSDTSLPPLVAAVMAGRLSEAPSYAPAPRRPSPSAEEIRKAEEARELLREMADLRERVQVYSARRNASRR